MKQSQRDFVINELAMFGEVSRNLCLKNYITRLGAIICKLKKEGYEINANYRETAYGKDFVYTVRSMPAIKSTLPYNQQTKELFKQNGPE